MIWDKMIKRWLKQAWSDNKGRKSKCARSNYVLWIPFFLSGSPNKCWLHTCDTCIMRASLVAGNKQATIYPNNLSQQTLQWHFTCYSKSHSFWMVKICSKIHTCNQKQSCWLLPFNWMSLNNDQLSSLL